MNNPLTDHDQKDIERQFLGAVLLRAALPPDIDKAVFSTEVHHLIFTEIEWLKDSAIEADIKILVLELKKQELLEQAGGAVYIADLTTGVSPVNANYYAGATEVHPGQWMRFGKPGSADILGCLAIVARSFQEVNGKHPVLSNSQFSR
jgi:hypothetical protein